MPRVDENGLLPSVQIPYPTNNWNLQVSELASKEGNVRFTFHHLRKGVSCLKSRREESRGQSHPTYSTSGHSQDSWRPQSNATTAKTPSANYETSRSNPIALSEFRATTDREENSRHGRAYVDAQRSASSQAQWLAIVGFRCHKPQRSPAVRTRASSNLKPCNTRGRDRDPTNEEAGNLSRTTTPGHRTLTLTKPLKQ